MGTIRTLFSKRWKNDESIIMIKTCTSITMLRPEEFIRAEIIAEGVCVFLADKSKIYLSIALAKLLCQLPSSRYFQSHRSHIINLSEIKYFNWRGCDKHVLLRNGDKVPVAKRRVKDLMNLQMNIAMDNHSE